jgi:hypothetical protein
MARTSCWASGIYFVRNVYVLDLRTELGSSLIDVQGTETFDELAAGTRFRWSFEVKSRGARNYSTLECPPSQHSSLSPQRGDESAAILADILVRSSRISSLL